MLYSADGRRLRRSIGFLPEYRVERETPAEVIELVADCVGDHEIKIDEETDETED